MLAKHLWKPKELFFWILYVYFLYRVLVSLAHPVNNFIKITWLINYDTGFTKRGLLGEVITNLFDAGHALPAIEIVSKLILVVIITIYFFIIFRYRFESYITLILILSPGLIMFPLNDVAVPGRVEQIGIIITALNCLLIRETLKYRNRLYASNNDRHLIFKTCLTVIVPVFMLSLLMFAHEATFLLNVPVNFILTFIFLFNLNAKRSELRSLFYAVVTYAPVGLSFLYIFLNKNDSISHAYDVCHNINNAFPELIANNRSKLLLILKFHVMPFPETIATSLHNFYRDFAIYTTFACLGFCLSMFSIMCITNVFQVERAKKTPISNNATRQTAYYYEPASGICSTSGSRNLNAIILYFFILPFICTLPLYVITIDWGRWIAPLNLQFVFTSLICLNPDVRPLITFPFIKRIHPFIKENTKATSLNNLKILSLFIFVCLLLRLPHWAGAPNHFLSRHVRFILWIVEQYR